MYLRINLLFFSKFIVISTKYYDILILIYCGINMKKKTINTIILEMHSRNRINNQNQ